jgi:hypothetical protein
MWCAYAFAILAFMGYRGATIAEFVQWFSTTFLQLVMLSIILVSQAIQNRAADRREAMIQQMLDALCDQEGIQPEQE